MNLDFETEDLQAEKPQALKEFFLDHFTQRLAADTQAWQVLTESVGSRAVVHQSQGASESRAVEFLYYGAAKDIALRSKLQHQLGLPVSAQWEDSEKSAMLSGLTALSDEVHRHEPAVQTGLEALRESSKASGSSGSSPRDLRGQLRQSLS